MLQFTKNFNQINLGDTNTAGGKGASLGEMVKAKIPIPSGFVILVSAFDRFLEETDLIVDIANQLKKINYKDMNTVTKISSIIRDLIHDTKMPRDLEKQFLKEFKKLKTKYVAVRSSATAEDSSLASWAGELESYLNTIKENLIKNVKKCWASLFTPRALFYAFEKKLVKLDHRKKIRVETYRGLINCYPVGIAVVIQKMVDSKISGICFTIHPVTKNKEQMIIEAGWGLGELVVGGKITPDNYVVSKKDWSILDINISVQDRMLIRNKKAGNKEVQVPKSKKSLQKLSKKQIISLARLCQKIENHYKTSQDIEWTLTENKFYILQARPITTL